MSRWKLLPLLLGCTALASSTVLAEKRPDAGRDKLMELFDPGAVAAGLCGPGGTPGSPYKPLSQAGQPGMPLAGDPPLWDNLGSLTYPISTTERRAQAYFDQGLRLAYGFNHAEARRAFRMAQKLDPGCAMCYWGEALVLGPNINVPMAPEAVGPAWAAARQAQARAGSASEREQALIRAVAARYSDDPKADRAALDAAYAEAMQKVAERFPDDPDIAVLYAESLMDLQPWDYWEAGGRKPKGRAAEIVATIERVLAAHPDHPGAIHYYIHMVEASNAPERAEPHAERLAALMPGAGHLVHMPSHIYYRVGRYLDSLAANKAAVKADEAYLAQVRAEGPYPLGLYPHNVHFLLTSAQMAGDGAAVIAAAEKLQRTLSDEAVRMIPWLHPVKAAPYFAHAQFSDPATILALPDPGGEFPYVKAMWHYARGVALANRGDLAAAQAEAAAIAELRQAADFTSLTAGGVPAGEVLRIAGHVLGGRIAQARDDLGTAVAEFERAVALQDALPYMEPPYWYYPVRQSLGAALLLAGDLDRAEQVFRASLIEAPNNGWALYGLLQVSSARRDHFASARFEELLDRAWAGDQEMLDLARL